MSSSWAKRPDWPPPSPQLRGLVFESAAMHNALLRLVRYADAFSTVILVGPTGAGKSVLAELVHWVSCRPSPFVEVSGAELASPLGEDVLFGHERGGFTSAERSRKGLLREAGAGTILLDDLHQMPQPVQGKLLRLLQSGDFRALGADRESPLLARIVVGLRDCPDKLMREGVLLPDLRYRLGYCIVRVPSLSERLEDIPLLAAGFLERCPEETGVPGPSRISAEALAMLVKADWPGNVRQLKAVIEAAYQNADTGPVLEAQHIPEELLAPLPFVAGGDKSCNDLAIAAALRQANGNGKLAAEILGVHRNTISEYRKRMRPSPVHSGPFCAVHVHSGKRRRTLTGPPGTSGERLAAK